MSEVADTLADILTKHRNDDKPERPGGDCQDCGNWRPEFHRCPHMPDGWPVPDIVSHCPKRLDDM